MRRRALCDHHPDVVYKGRAYEEIQINAAERVPGLQCSEWSLRSNCLMLRTILSEWFTRVHRSIGASGTGPGGPTAGPREPAPVAPCRGAQAPRRTLSPQGGAGLAVSMVAGAGAYRRLGELDVR